MELLSTRDRWWMTQCEAALQAESVESRWLTPWDARATSTMILEVSDEQAAAAVEILSEQLGEEIRRRQAERAPVRWVPVLLQPAFAAALCSALLLIAFYLVTGGADHPSLFFRRGAMIAARIPSGEWWRFITAATLHADLEHVLSNAGFLVVLGWAAYERFGVGVGLFVWLVTAVAGFAASFVFSDATLTVGASGGLFGLLGAAGGHGLRRHGDSEFPLRDKVRAGGAAILLLAFTAFSPEANIPAHVGGFVAGFVIGAMMPATRPLGAAWQVTACLATVAILVGAWRASGAL